MNGVQSHSHVLTDANIYLGMLSLHVQNFIWLVKKFLLKFAFCIEHQ